MIEISLAAKKHWELEIKILRDAPRDPEKLRKILKAKQKEYEQAEDSEDIERLVPEIEMLKFVLCFGKQKYEKRRETPSQNKYHGLILKKK